MAISGEIEKLERRWKENPSGLMFAPLAEACRKAGSPARALEILEHGLRVHPDYVPALIVRGRCHLEMGGMDEAQAAFDQALTRDPVNPIALRSLAEVLERMGRPREAAERIELLLEVDRGDDEARAVLDRLRQLASAQTDAPADAATAAAESGGAPARAAAESTESGPFTLLDEGSELAFETEEERPGLLLESSGVPAEARLEVENLSVDPMASGEPAPFEAPARLPWEPLPEPALAGYVPGEFLAPAAADDEVPQAMAPQEVEEMIASAAPVPEAAETEPGPPAPEPVTAAADLEAAWTPPVAPVLWTPAPDAPATEVPDSLPPAVAEAEPELAEPAPASEPPAMVIPEQRWASGEPVPPESPEAEAVEWPAIEAAAQEMETLGSADEAGLEPASIEEPASAVEAAGPAAEDPTLIVTESMAEVFLRQGHVSLALAVYRQLAERSPEADSIREAIRRLEGAVETTPAAPEPVRVAYRAAETGGRSVAHMLRSVLEAPAPVTASTVLPPAIEPAGEPTRADSQPLSLGAVFGDEPAAPPPMAEAPRASGEPSYDEFFGAVPTADVGATGAPRDPEVADLRQFNDWLRGLKR
jgi:tetratricopeptide (TPR) repeat protein